MVEQLILALTLLNTVVQAGLVFVIWHGYRVVRPADLAALKQITPDGIVRRMESLEQRQDRIEIQVREGLAAMVTMGQRVENVIPHLDGAVRMMTRVSQNVTAVGEEVKQVVERLETNQHAVQAVAEQLARLTLRSPESS